MWKIEEKERPRVELPAMWRISFAPGMKRAKPRVPLLNWADFPEFWPFWVWHSYLKLNPELEKLVQLKFCHFRVKDRPNYILMFWGY